MTDLRLSELLVFELGLPPSLLVVISTTETELTSIYRVTAKTAIANTKEIVYPLYGWRNPLRQREIGCEESRKWSKFDVLMKTHLILPK